MPVHQVLNFTMLSKEESVTVSVTESDWIQSGELREKQISCGARKASGIGREVRGTFSVDRGSVLV